MRRALALLLLAGPVLASPRGAERPAASATSAITTWVLHFDPRLNDLCFDAYADLLAAIPADARILVGVCTPDDAWLFESRLGLDAAPDARIAFVDSGRPVTGWARDRYVVFPRHGRPTLAIQPDEEVEPAYAGDAAVGRALLPRGPGLALLETRLRFEGGDILLSDDRVACGIGTFMANLEFGEVAQVRAEIETLFGRKLIVLGTDPALLPHEHCDMYLAFPAPRTALVGDPTLALSYFDALQELGLEEGDIRGVGTFRRETQLKAAAAYEAIATQLAEEGYAVERVPALHSEEGEMLTWTNAVLERRDGGMRAYVPAYGVPLLDKRAHAAWVRTGCEVFPIRADKIVRQGGAIRCLTQEVRTPPAPPPVRR